MSARRTHIDRVWRQHFDDALKGGKRDGTNVVIVRCGSKAAKTAASIMLDDELFDGSTDDGDDDGDNSGGNGNDAIPGVAAALTDGNEVTRSTLATLFPAAPPAPVAFNFAPDGPTLPSCRLL